MAGRRLEEVTLALIAAGRAPSTPAAIVEAGTWAHQRVLEAPLASIAARTREEAVGSPALLVVGEVVSLRAQLPTLARTRPGMAGPEQFLKVEAGHE
ncbi:hypothetical protein ACN28S_32315 [Cystobacter fuscus]